MGRSKTKEKERKEKKKAYRKERKKTTKVLKKRAECSPQKQTVEQRERAHKKQRAQDQPAELTHDDLELQDVHCEEHVRLVFKNEVAFPEGGGTFVDTFDAKNRRLHVRKAAESTVLHVNNAAGEEVYAIEGTAFVYLPIR